MATSEAGRPSHPDSYAEAVVGAALDAYARLPKHGKPARRDNGVVEWTVFASIVLSYPPPSPPSSPSSSHTTSSTLVPSLGTGVKCLPATRLPPLGDTLHDSHAEVLARRGFVRWLIDEAGRLVRGEAHSGVLEYDKVDGGLGRFALRGGVQVWLYVSALPCGDASTLHTAAHQPKSDAAAYAATNLETTLSSVEGAARGRSGYANFGAIRTKPGRKDSPPSISFSCSDKIATWCALGLQGGLLDHFAPVYLDHVIVGGVAIPEGRDGEGEEWRDEVRREVERSLYGRLEGIADLMLPPYGLHRPRVHLTPTPFPFDKPEGETATANTSLVSVHGSKAEVLVNGCVQTSAWRPPGRTLVKEKLRSRVSRFEVLRAYLDLEAAMGRHSGGWEREGARPREAEVGRQVEGDGVGQHDLDGLASRPGAKRQCESGGTQTGGPNATYASLKARNTPYAAAKRVLRGNVGAPVTGWTLPHEFCATAGEAPFSGWIVSGDAYASFTASGEVKE